MRVLVCYDVQVSGLGGERRLRRVAKLCRDFGQRVQYSVFELDVEPAQWVAVRQRLIEEVDLTCDSLRFYMLGRSDRTVVEHLGAKVPRDLSGPLIL